MTRRPDGRAIPATVVLSAIDESSTRSAQRRQVDPLPELYASLDDGIRAIYASHQTPRPRPSGGDTAAAGTTTASAISCSSRRSTPVRMVVAPSSSASPPTSPHGMSAPRPSACGLRLGAGATQIPVGLPFFVDASIAPEYLLADRPSIQIRGFGTALALTDRRHIHRRRAQSRPPRDGLRADAFEAVTVRLPRLKLGTHSITITARTGSGQFDAAASGHSAHSRSWPRA